MVKLFRKNSNLCDHNLPTSQTDGQTDDMRAQDRALHSSASRGKKSASRRRAKGDYEEGYTPSTLRMQSGIWNIFVVLAADAL